MIDREQRFIKANDIIARKMEENLIREIEPAVPIEMRRDALGKQGEELAARYLQRKGYDLVLANFRVPIGRNRKGVQVTGEIDIVALDGDVLCFVEVKARSSEDFAPALTAVDLRKQRQITRAARLYRRVFKLDGIEHRYDVITVVKSDGRPAKIELTKGFWTEAKFRKKAWDGEFQEQLRYHTR